LPFGQSEAWQLNTCVVVLTDPDASLSPWNGQR